MHCNCIKKQQYCYEYTTSVRCVLFGYNISWRRSDSAACLFCWYPSGFSHYVVEISGPHGVTSTERPQHVWKYENKLLAGLTEIFPQITDIKAVKRLACNCNNVFRIFSLLRDGFCTSVTNNRVGDSECQVDETGSRATKRESYLWTRPRCAAESRLGARYRGRTQPDQSTHSQKGFEKIETGTTASFRAGANVNGGVLVAPVAQLSDAL